MFSNPPCNSFNDAVCILQDVFRREAEHRNAQRFQIRLTNPVVLGYIRVFVCKAVYLDCKAQRAAVEVDDIPLNNVLPSKRNAVYLLPANPMPQPSFALRHVPAKLPRHRT